VKIYRIFGTLSILLFRYRLIKEDEVKGYNFKYNWLPKNRSLLHQIVIKDDKPFNEIESAFNI
jgi:hypothetical protein